MQTLQISETNIHIIVFCSCHTSWKAGGGEAKKGQREMRCDAKDARDKNRSGEGPSTELMYTRLYNLKYQTLVQRSVRLRAARHPLELRQVL